MRAQMREGTFEEIVECITNPDAISLEPESKKCYKKLHNKNQYLLLCYTSDLAGVVTVVTVIKTSKIDKYL